MAGNATYNSIPLVDPSRTAGVKGAIGNDSVSRKNQENRINAITDRTTKVSSQLDISENMQNGIGALIYGGLSARKQVGSYLGMYDKYYKAATGRSRFEANGLNPRMFNQLLIMDRNTAQQIQPFIKGRFIFVPGVMPRCMEILHPDETDYVRNAFMTSVISVSGFAARQLEVATVNAMTEQNSYDVITKQTGRTNKLTFKFMTLTQGLPLYRYFTTWMQYIYNAGSSAATYPLYTGLEYHEGNHSMNGVYIVPDPSFQMVEEAALVYNMVPLENDANTILDQQWGSHELVEYEIDFKVHTLPGGMPQVLRIAQGVLADYVAEVELHDYYVNPSTNTDYNPATSTMGLGSQLFGEAGKSAMARAVEAERTNISSR